ncbi:MAG: hypothetical protein AAF846_16550 [Chloroflexota bacterium]
MATWIAHLRLAQNLLDAGFDLEITPFTIGNIAPDCGIPDDDGSFIPPSSVTHFGQEGEKAGPHIFYDKHMEDKHFNREKYSFMVGYYAHLLADVAWSEDVYRPKKVTPLWAEGLKDNPKFIWTIKNDWYGHDFVYLYNHPDSLFYTAFAPVEIVPDYLEFVPEGNLTKAVHRIKNYYDNQDITDFALAHDYPYLSRDEMETYIQNTTERLIQAFDAIRVPKVTER